MWNKTGKCLLKSLVWVKCGLQVGGYVLSSLSSAGTACPGCARKAEDLSLFSK